MATHLAIFDRATIEETFSGRKKVEGRFSKIKIPPFGVVSAGDLVYMKISGEKIVGQFIVDRVLHFDHPRAEELQQLIKKYSKELRLSNTFWLSHEKVDYVTLMFIQTVTKFLVPPDIKKRDLRGWVVLE